MRKTLEDAPAVDGLDGTLINRWPLVEAPLQVLVNQWTDAIQRLATAPTPTTGTGLYDSQVPNLFCHC